MPINLNDPPKKRRIFRRVKDGEPYFVDGEPVARQNFKLELVPDPQPVYGGGSVAPRNWSPADEPITTEITSHRLGDQVIVSADLIHELVESGRNPLERTNLGIPNAPARLEDIAHRELLQQIEDERVKQDALSTARALEQLQRDRRGEKRE